MTEISLLQKVYQGTGIILNASPKATLYTSSKFFHISNVNNEKLTPHMQQRLTELGWHKITMLNGQTGWCLDTGAEIGLLDQGFGYGLFL